MALTPISPSDVFSVDVQNGKITISADPEITSDLAYVLSTLLELSRYVRAKVTHARALAMARDIGILNERQNEFKAQAQIAYNKFLAHLNNGCNGNKAKALQCIKADFNVGYCDAKILVTEGRRLSKVKPEINPTNDARKEKARAKGNATPRSKAQPVDYPKNTVKPPHMTTTQAC